MGGIDPKDMPTLRRVRLILCLFVFALVLSGLTAFPLLKELDLICNVTQSSAEQVNSLDRWLGIVRMGLHETYAKYPWVAYGTDWLAFAHIAIAVFFLGAIRNPVQNVWVIEAGLITCILVLPLALICGPVRGIPWGWRLIDCSFGFLGCIPLLYCRALVLRITHSSGSSRAAGRS